MKRFMTKKASTQLTVALVGVVLTMNYSNCSPVNFNGYDVNSEQRAAAAAGIVISNGAAYSKEEFVPVSIENQHYKEYFMTNDPTCETGGKWEPIQPLRMWVLSGQNKETSVFAKFRNQSIGAESGCLSDSIIHDNIKPVLKLIKPEIVSNAATLNYAFSAEDANGIARTICGASTDPNATCNSPASAGALPEGLHIIPLKTYDKAGNESEVVNQSLLVDRTVPVVIITLPPPALTNQNEGKFEFTATDDRSQVKDLECSEKKEGPYKACTSPYNYAGLADGKHEYFVRARDNAGNVSEGTSVAFEIDRSTPTVRITKGPADFTNKSQVNFEFEGVNTVIKSFECKVDSGTWEACISGVGYPKNNVAYNDGQHTFQVRGTNAAGTVSAPATKTWIQDRQTPEVIYQLTPDAVTNKLAANFGFTATDANLATVECSLNNGAFTPCTNSFTGTVAGNGNQGFQVRATDKANNQTIAVFNWKVDRSAPVINFTKTPDSPSGLREFTFGFQATDDSPGTLKMECKLDNSAYVACTSATTHLQKSIDEGARTFTVKATDVAGNSSEKTHSWTVDLTGPIISFTLEPLAALTEREANKLNFNVNDVSGISSCKQTLGTETKDCVLNAVQSISKTPGKYTFEVRATDSIGNVSVASRTWDVQTFEEVIQSIKPALAVRGLHCMLCHGQIDGNLLTDFGYSKESGYSGHNFAPQFGQSKPYFFIGDMAFGNNRAPWQTAKINGTVFVPKATFTESMAKDVFGGTNPPMNFKDVLERANYAPSSNSKAQPAMANAINPLPGEPKIVELNSLKITYPTDSEILNLIPSEQRSQALHFGPVVNAVDSSVTNIMKDASGNFIRIAEDGQEVVCKGDIVVKGTLFLENLKLRTDAKGCRLYVTGSVFIQGPIVYAAGVSGQNLQISSTRLISMGLDAKRMGATGNLTGNIRGGECDDSLKSWAGNCWTRFGGVRPRQYMPGVADADRNAFFDGIVIEAVKLGSRLKDAAPGPGQPRASYDYSGLLLNAPHVHSRYDGSLRGVIIAEVAMLQLENNRVTNGHYKYDPVFDNESVRLLPALPRAPLTATKQAQP